MTTQPAKNEERAIKRAPKIERRGENSETHLVGYAAVFFRDDDPGTEYKLWENVYERIVPGAFDKIAENDVRGLFNHNRDLVLGRVKSGTMTLGVDEVGLRYDITLADTQTARDLAAAVERGDIDGSSFAFVATSVTWRDEERSSTATEIREINGCDVYDVGPVTFPAYTATTSSTSAVAERSRDEWRAAEQTERAKQKRRARRIAYARARE